MTGARTTLWWLVVTGSAVALLARPPELSGTWRLDEARSRVDAEAAFAGLIGAGAPGTLHVTQPANGTLVVESQVNESHARLYVPGEETSTPVFLGEVGSVTVSSRWDGGALIAEGVRETGSGAASTKTRVRETFRLAADGRTLEVELSTGDGDEGRERTSSLRYTRIDDVGGCESWPSPCKVPPR